MSLPRMSWHIGDYKKDTGHLRAIGHGAYFMLCMHYWATGELPHDDKQLAAIACLTDREWKLHKAVLKAFFKAGEWKHKRIEEELTLAQAKYLKRVAAGKKGGEAKAKNKQSSSNATAMPYQPITDKEEDAGSSDPPSPEKEFFERGKKLLGESSGGLLARLLKSKQGSAALARSALEMASTKENPREYLGRIITGPARSGPVLMQNGQPHPDGII